MFPIQDDYASQIYGIVVCVDMYMYSLQVANMYLHFTNVKRNVINHYNVNKLSTQNVYHVNQDSRIFSKVHVCQCCTSLVQLCSERSASQ